jgi:hypothetical protein
VTLPNQSSVSSMRSMLLSIWSMLRCMADSTSSKFRSSFRDDSTQNSVGYAFQIDIRESIASVVGASA